MLIAGKANVVVDFLMSIIEDQWCYAEHLASEESIEKRVLLLQCNLYCNVLKTTARFWVARKPVLPVAGKVQELSTSPKIARSVSTLNKKFKGGGL